MSYEPEPYYGGESRAAERTNLPGILLIVVGIINILWGLYLIGNGAYQVTSPKHAIQSTEELAKIFPALAQAKQTPDDVRRNGILSALFGVLVLIGCFLTIFGGIRMRQLQSYGLAMTGAITAAIPCISCMGCCGVGEAIGIWAVVVLLNEEVKRYFR
jgi:hypothetical protein